MFGYPGNLPNHPHLLASRPLKEAPQENPQALGGQEELLRVKPPSLNTFCFPSTFLLQWKPKIPFCLSTSAAFDCFSSRSSELRGLLGVLSSLLIFLCGINKTHVDARAPSTPQNTHRPLPSLSKGEDRRRREGQQDGSAPDQWIFETQTHGPGPTLHVLITTHVPIKESVKHKGPKEQSEARTFQGIK